MAKMYRVKLDADDDEVSFGKPKRSLAARRLIRKKLQVQGGPFSLWTGQTPGQKVNRNTVDKMMQVIKNRFDSSKVGDLIFIRTSKKTIVVRKVLKRIVPALPSQAKTNGWRKSDKRLWRFIMWRPGTIWQGDYNCRNARGTTTPSQHSWRNPIQAIDFGFRTARQGDKVVAKVRGWKDDQGKTIFFVCWENCVNHRSWNHGHFEHIPRKTGIPPCMK